MLVAVSSQTKRSPFLPPRWFIRAAWAVHRALYAITGGRLGLGKPTETSYGTLRLHTTGRKSGAERVAMLGYFEDGPNLFTLAMNGWGEPEPAWWLNLQASPDATIDLPDGHREIHAPDRDRRRARAPLVGDRTAQREPRRLRRTPIARDRRGRVRAPTIPAGLTGQASVRCSSSGAPPAMTPRTSARSS